MILLFRGLLLTIALLAFAACESDPFYSYSAPRKAYYRVRVTNVRGELIADWIASGKVSRTEYGHRFSAVERITGSPNLTEIHYPEGRTVDVRGPNVLISRCGKPQWLVDRDGF